jgi:membrane dipeptidase
VIPVFDGHNDTITREDAGDFAAGREGGHVDLPRARAGGLAGGIFALFTATPGADRHAGEIELAAPIGQELAAADATRAAGRLLALERAGHVRIAHRAADLDAALADGVLAAVMHLEGAEAIDPGLSALELWHAAGLRSLGPVWSRANAFGHGVPFAFPSSPDTGPGLTRAGKALVRRCAELGIAVDLSHLNEAGFWDVAQLDGGPLIASHSGVHALSPCSRNLTDRQLDAIASSGGLVGIVFAVGFLRADGKDDADTPLATIVAHVRYAADRMGVDHVALGSDFDGATVPAELADVAGLPRLLAALREDGFSAADVEAIAWGNWRRELIAERSSRLPAMTTSCHTYTTGTWNQVA